MVSNPWWARWRSHVMIAGLGMLALRKKDTRIGVACTVPGLR